MKLGELVGSGRALGEDWAQLEISGLTADSREVEPGFVFAALPGTQADGARFIPQAIEKGAVAILLSENTPAKQGLDLPVIEDPDPRRLLALMAARFYGARPETVVAVTGTNGKTSVVSFLRQIWLQLGMNAASLGTIGVATRQGPRRLVHTTPDPVALHRVLAELAGEGVTHLALEASSHGLQQRRVDGVRLAAAGFTNISRDHLDYHDSFEAYLAQKLRLFTELLPDGAPVVVDTDSPGGEAVVEAAGRRGLPLLTVGRSGETLRLEKAERDAYNQHLTIAHGNARHDVTLPLVGGFQSSNALVAAGLCLACGADAETVLPLLGSLKGATGRLELAGTTRAGAPIFIDYAHTPDALGNALEALRPHAGGRLVVLFGCGGDRDTGKRPEMGAVAAARADLVYVTDDNPRTEDPAAIRREILDAAAGAIEVGDRRDAITAAIAALEPGDVLLIAGKGHETGQILADKVIPFRDHDVVQVALARERAHD